MFIEILLWRQRHLTGVFYVFAVCRGKRNSCHVCTSKIPLEKKNIFMFLVFRFFSSSEWKQAASYTSMTHYWLVWKTLVFCCIPFLFLIPASFPVFVFIVFRFALCLQYSDFLPDALNSLMYSRNLVCTCWTFTWQIVINKMSTYQSLVRTCFGQTVLLARWCSNSWGVTRVVF